MSKLYGAFTKNQRYKLIEDSLDLMVSYFGQDPDIFVHSSDRTIGFGNKDEDNIHYFRSRFILAKWIEFKEIIGSLDSMFSSSYEPVREEFVGKIQGTLLVAEYSTKKWNNILERRYPCLISSENFDTPENVLIYLILVYLYKQIKQLHFPRNSAEYGLRSKAISECSNMLKHPVFHVVKSSSFMNMKQQKLLALVKSRNKRGQTGNVKKINLLTKWYSSLSWTSLIDEGPEKLDLVFGNSPYTWDKFFEIWVLAKLLEFLNFEGTKLFTSVDICMASLEQRNTGPIAVVKADNYGMDIYFQNSSLLNGVWKYRGATSLRGIPDIVISIKGTPETIILIDVKNIVYQNRKDANTEKYKMLGYFETYRESIGHEPIGILILRNDNEFVEDILYTDKNAQLSLLTTAPACSLEAFSSIATYLWALTTNPQKTTSRNNQPYVDDNALIVRQEAAHSAAKNLASKKPEELLRCKAELKRYIFPNTWDNLPDECKTLLGMAELLYQNLQEQCGVDPDVDWGPTVLEYCRAVEFFLNHELIIPFKKSSQFQIVLQMCNSNDLHTYEYLVDKKTLMFGELARFFKDLQNSDEGIFDFIRRSSHLNQHIDFWRRSLPKILSGINTNYRRKSAHIDLLSAEDATNCRIRIVGSAENKGLFPQLLRTSAK